MSRGIRLLSGIQHVELTEFPSNPSLGTIEFVNGVLWIYALYQSVTTWYPLSAAKSTYVHSQGAAQTVWTVNHGLNTKNVFVAVYDNNNVIMSADVQHKQDLELNWYTEITLDEALTGYAVLVAETSLDVPVISAATVTTQTIELGTKTLTDANLDATHLGGIAADQYLTVNDTLDGGSV